MPDIPVTIVISGEYVQKVKDMLISNGGVEITISLFGGKLGSYTYKFLPRQPGEGDIAFTKRFIRDNLMAHLRLKAQNDKIAKVRQRISDLPEILTEKVEEGTIT